jgi:hypothetical protein
MLIVTPCASVNPCNAMAGRSGSSVSRLARLLTRHVLGSAGSARRRQVPDGSELALPLAAEKQPQEVRQNRAMELSCRTQEAFASEMP